MANIFKGLGQRRGHRGGRSRPSSRFGQVTHIDREMTGIEHHRKPFNAVIVSTGARIFLKFAKGEKNVLQMREILQDLGINVVYEYVIADMIVMELPLIGADLSKRLFAVLGKAGLDYGWDMIQGKKPRSFNTLVMENGMTELVVFAYDMFLSRMRPSAAGRSRIFV